MKINKGDCIEMSRTKPWQQRRFIKLCEDCGWKKSCMFDLDDDRLGVGKGVGFINTYKPSFFTTNITDKFLAWLEENPAFCIDVSGFDIEKKKRVQEAFFKMGFEWPQNHKSYAFLDENFYSTLTDGGKLHGFLMWGCCSANKSQKPYEVTYDELMEVAGMKDEVNLKALLKPECVVTYRDGRKRIVFMDKLVDKIGSQYVIQAAIDSFNSDLTHECAEEMDIIRITDRDGTIIWQRPPEKRKVTLELTEEQERTIKEQLGL